MQSCTFVLCFRYFNGYSRKLRAPLAILDPIRQCSVQGPKKPHYIGPCGARDHSGHPGDVLAL